MRRPRLLGWPAQFPALRPGWDSVQDPALKSAGVLGWTKGGDTVDYHASFAIAPTTGWRSSLRALAELQFHRSRNRGADRAAQRPGRDERHQEDAQAGRR